MLVRNTGIEPVNYAEMRVADFTGNPPYSISPYSAVKRYSGKGDTTLHDAPPVRCGQPAVSAAGPPGGITW
jgi:hypothetical protein